MMMMIAKFVLFCSLVILQGLWVFAQEEYPRVELFGGYSYANVDMGPFALRRHGHGWGASLSGNSHKHFGVHADFSGHYVRLPGFQVLPSLTIPPLRFRNYEFLFGPRATARTGRVTVFGHALLGVANSRVSGPILISGGSRPPERPPRQPKTERALLRPPVPVTHFAMGFGGGLDARLSRRIAWRVLQVDYIPVHIPGGWLHHVRVQTGIVFKWAHTSF